MFDNDAVVAFWLDGIVEEDKEDDADDDEEDDEDEDDEVNAAVVGGVVEHSLTNNISLELFVNWHFLLKPRGRRRNEPSSNMNSQLGSIVQ